MSDPSSSLETAANAQRVKEKAGLGNREHSRTTQSNTAYELLRNDHFDAWNVGRKQLVNARVVRDNYPVLAFGRDVRTHLSTRRSALILDSGYEQDVLDLRQTVLGDAALPDLKREPIRTHGVFYSVHDFLLDEAVIALDFNNGGELRWRTQVQCGIVQEGGDGVHCLIGSNLRAGNLQKSLSFLRIALRDFADLLESHDADFVTAVRFEA